MPDGDKNIPDYVESTNRKVYNIDFDGTLTHGEYTNDPTPSFDMIDKVNELYYTGHIIIIWSARQWDNARFMVAWLIKHAIPFHGIMLGKGGTDVYIDDKAINASDFLKDDKSINIRTKILSFIESKNSFTWKELISKFHLDVESIIQLREYLTTLQQAGLIKSKDGKSYERNRSHKKESL